MAAALRVARAALRVAQVALPVARVALPVARVALPQARAEPARVRAATMPPAERRSVGAVAVAGWQRLEPEVSPAELVALAEERAHRSCAMKWWAASSPTSG